MSRLSEFKNARKNQVWISRPLVYVHYLGNTALIGSSKAALQSW
jgi:hypothetical protein